MFSLCSAVIYQIVEEVAGGQRRLRQCKHVDEHGAWAGVGRWINKIGISARQIRVTASKDTSALVTAWHLAEQRHTNADDPQLHFDRALIYSFVFNRAHIYTYFTNTPSPHVTRHFHIRILSVRPFPSRGSLVRFILSHQWVLRHMTAEEARRTCFQACFLSAMSQDEKHVSSKNTWRLKFHASEIDTQSKSGWFAGGRNLPLMVRNLIARLLLTYKT